MTEAPLLCSVREAGQRLGIGRDRTYQLVAEGRLRAIHLGRRKLIPVSELEAFIGREVSTNGKPDDESPGR